MRIVYFCLVYLLASCNYNKYLVSYNGYPKAPDYRLERNWVTTPKKPIPLPKDYVDNAKSYSFKIFIYLFINRYRCIFYISNYVL